MTTNKNKKKPTSNFEVQLGLVLVVAFVAMLLASPEILIGLVLFSFITPGVTRLMYWETVDKTGTRGANYDSPTVRK